MRELVRGMFGSLLIYLLLPDVGLTKIETILVLIVGWMVCTSVVWTIQELFWRRKRERMAREFRKLIERTTL